MTNKAENLNLLLNLNLNNRRWLVAIIWESADLDPTRRGPFNPKKLKYDDFISTKNQVPTVL